MDERRTRQEMPTEQHFCVFCAKSRHSCYFLLIAQQLWPPNLLRMLEFVGHTLKSPQNAKEKTIFLLFLLNTIACLMAVCAAQNANINCTQHLHTN